MYMILTKRNIVIIILSLLLIIGFTFACKYFIAAASKDTNWGLGFGKSGTRPTGNVTSEQLKEFNSYYIAPEGNKKLYITFDAGYEAGYTPKILEALKKHNVKATFFMVGTLLKSNPDLIKQIDTDGHIIANHSMHHPNMSKMSTMEDFKKEIEPVEILYKEITGKDMKKFYRPPQGIFSKTNLKMANELGYKTIFWSLAYVDWYKNKQPSHEEAFDKIMSRVHDGAIILLHSTSKTNSEILDELLTKLEKQGYTFGTLEELQ
ncbi:MAG: polysaccharide deacetylase family protein [Clostridia bacterium]|nr:polysaccharide deacetylase family protein [Clostridia bacterium]